MTGTRENTERPPGRTIVFVCTGNTCRSPLAEALCKRALADMLGVIPGAVTPFGVVNDGAGRVKAVLDEELLGHEVVNAHPLVNTATTSIDPADLVAFMRSVDHEPAILKVATQSPDSRDTSAEMVREG